MDPLGAPCCPGSAFVAGELLLCFEPGTPEARVEAIADDVGAAVIRFIADFSGPIYLMQVPVGEELAYIALFDAFRDVRFGEMNGVGCIPELPPCSCCPPGIICASLLPCVQLFPVVLTVDKSSGTAGNLIVSWSRDCFVGDTQDHGLYEGALGDWYSHTRVDCSDDGGDLSEELTPSPGSRYYVVVPLEPSAEGSYGTDSRRLQRPPGSDVCQSPQEFTACPGVGGGG